MSITLKWTNPSVLDEVQVFRSDTPLAAGAIPTGSPIATITDKSQSYTDNTSVQNKYYYYTLAFKTAGELVYAPQSVAINMPYTGPGPQTIQTGTWERGIFGFVAASEMVTNQELQAFLGGGTAFATNGGWLKLIWKGKIMFYPLYRVCSLVSWNMVYLAGCMYGVAGNGPSTGHGLTPTDQGRVISKGEHDFLLRLPRVSSTADFSWGGNNRDLDSEWHNMICACFNQNSASPAFDLADYLASSYFDATSTIFMEFSGANCANLTSAVPTAVAAPSIARTSAGSLWRPILELVL